MPRYIAFLRAINVGGRVVKMDRLRGLFEEAGLTGVSTFIASGNVLFEAKSRSEATLAKKIESSLLAALGYDVDTFLRTPKELAAVAALQPFNRNVTNAEENSLYVGFVRTTIDAAARQRLVRLNSPTNTFHVEGREYYWLCRGSLLDSGLDGKKLEKALGMAATMRNMNTVNKLAALCS